MTQEGQALPSPTQPESPAEPNTAANTTTDLPAEAHNQAVQDKPGAGAKDEIEEGKQQEEIREGEQEVQGQTQGEGVKDEGGEGELKEERGDDEDQQVDGGAEGEREGMRGEGCMNVKVSSAGEEAMHEEEGMKEEEEGKENEEMQASKEEEATDLQQAGRLVHKIISAVALSINVSP